MKVCPSCRRCFEDTVSKCVDRTHPALARGPAVPLEVGGRWRIERLVEASEDGAEFLGRHVELGRPVEIRVSTGPASCPGRTRIAARALAAIRQENAARIEDFGSLLGGGSYAAVERFGDETLRDTLDRLGPLGVPEAALLGRQIAEAPRLAAHGTVSRAPRALVRGDRRRARIPRRADRDDHLLPERRARRRRGIRSPRREPSLRDAVRRSPASSTEARRSRSAASGRTSPKPSRLFVMQAVHQSPAMRPRSPAEVARRLRIFERAPDARSAWPAPPPASPSPPLEIVVEDTAGRRPGSTRALGAIRGSQAVPEPDAGPGATVAVALPPPAPPSARLRLRCSPRRREASRARCGRSGRRTARRAARGPHCCVRGGGDRASSVARDR